MAGKSLGSCQVFWQEDGIEVERESLWGMCSKFNNIWKWNIGSEYWAGSKTWELK